MVTLTHISGIDIPEDCCLLQVLAVAFSCCQLTCCWFVGHLKAVLRLLYVQMALHLHCQIIWQCIIQQTGTCCFVPQEGRVVHMAAPDCLL